MGFSLMQKLTFIDFSVKGEIKRQLKFLVNHFQVLNSVFIFALMHLSRSEMKFSYVISTKLADIEFSSIQRDRRVFNNSKFNNKMKANKFYLFHYGFKAPQVF